MVQYLAELYHTIYDGKLGLPIAYNFNIIVR